MSKIEELRSGKIPIVWILGGPGSGKGTQCECIIAQYGFTHLSTGDLLREEVISGSERGKRLDEIMKMGELVPNEVVLSILRDAMLSKMPGAKGFLIDGYPRERQQGIDFEEIIAPATLILYFDCSDETLFTRLMSRAKTSGRSDDNEQTIRLRLQTFRRHNDGVIEQYKARVVRINSEKIPSDVFAVVQMHIDTIMKPRV